MQFNPRIGFILGILVTIEIAISSGTVSLTNVVPAAYVPYVVGWCGLLAFMGSTILTFLHAYSSGQPGPLVSAPPAASPPAGPKAVPAIVLLIAGTAILGLLCPGTAYAQSSRVPVQRPAFTPTPGLTGDPIKDIENASAAKKQQAIANGNQSVEDLVAAIQKLALPDFQYALAMSKATNNVVSTPCWQSWVDLITAQQSPLMGPGAPVLDAGGKPTLDASGKPVLGPPQALVEPDPHLITSVEQISELLANLRPDSTLSTGCAALAAAAGKDAATLISGILNGGALGLFKLPVPIGPIP